MWGSDIPQLFSFSLSFLSFNIAVLHYTFTPQCLGGSHHCNETRWSWNMRQQSWLMRCNPLKSDSQRKFIMYQNVTWRTTPQLPYKYSHSEFFGKSKRDLETAFQHIVCSGAVKGLLTVTSCKYSGGPALFWPASWSKFIHISTRPTGRSSYLVNDGGFHMQLYLCPFSHVA